MGTDMKKLIIAFLVLLLPSFSWAGSQQIRQVVGMAKSSSGSSCMSGTYLFAWDGSHTSGTDFACDGDGNSIDGAVTGSPAFSTSYGEDGSEMAMRIDANGEYVTWADSAGTLVDINGAQTVWLRVYFDSVPIGYTRVWHAGNTDPLSTLLVEPGPATIRGLYSHLTTTETKSTSSAITEDAWVDIAYSWDATGADHAVNLGSTWQEDLNELPTGPVADVTNIRIGTYFGFVMSGSYYSITKFAVVSGYKAAKPW